MKRIVNLIEGLFLLYVAWSCFAYYTGRVKLTDEKQNRRKRIVEKYAWLLIVVMVVTILSGLGLLIIGNTGVTH
jgi:hypothetical protein